MGFYRRHRCAAVIAVLCLALTGCAKVVDGGGTLENAANANLAVKGTDSKSEFDQQVKNALFDIELFWRETFPSVSGGKALTPLAGGLYSVDGAQVVKDRRVTGPALDNGCVKRSPAFVIDNGAFCVIDDSIIWDRAGTHLFAQLAAKYGPLMVGLFFAHEFGHAISFRLGVFDRDLPTIDTESQADCAAGAWAAWALAHHSPHFRTITADDLDNALEGYLDSRDNTPTSDEPELLSHGNGFDRLSAMADGIAKGAKFCFADNYFDRTFTERTFGPNEDPAAGGNVSFDDTIKISDNSAVKDLNRYWVKAAKTIPATFPPVSIKDAGTPKCGSPSTSKLGYCPDDNTVYFDRDFARKAYNSFPGLKIDETNAEVTLLVNQPADNALGTLFAIGWGLAVRDKVFHRTMETKQAFVSAICYTGAYAKDINLATDPDARTPQARFLLLSPADLDEAVSILLNRDLIDQSFGSLGTTGLDRIQSFVKGYKQGLSKC